MAKPWVHCLPPGRLENAGADGIVGYLESHDWALCNTIGPSGKGGPGFVRLHCPRCGVDFGLFFSEGTRPHADASSTKGDTR